MADTGFVAATAVAEQTGDAGTAWTSPAQAITDDDTAAAVITPASTVDSKRIRYSGFDMTGIPDGATIDGIRFRLNGYVSAGEGGFRVNLNSAEADVFSEKTTTTTATANSNLVTLGGTSDLWGATPTKDSFQTGFTVDLQVWSVLSTAIIVAVDAAWLEVTYTPPAGGASRTHRIRPQVILIDEDEEDSDTVEIKDNMGYI